MSIYTIRDLVDMFYVKERIVRDCLAHLDMKDYDHVVEPLVGESSFYDEIDHENKVGLDIFPVSPLIKRGNWLSGKKATSRSLPPLRTVRAAFAAYSSSIDS